MLGGRSPGVTTKQPEGRVYAPNLKLAEQRPESAKGQTEDPKEDTSQRPVPTKTSQIRSLRIFLQHSNNGVQGGKTKNPKIRMDYFPNAP